MRQPVSGVCVGHRAAAASPASRRRRCGGRKLLLAGTDQTTTIHFVPLPRSVFPTPQPLFSREQSSRPETTRSTPTAGVRATRLKMRARFSAKRPAPPNPATAASRSKGAETSPAYPASELRSEESTESLPTPGGSPIHGRPPLCCLGGWGSKGAIFFHYASVSNGPDRAIGPPSALLTLFIPHFATPNHRHFKGLSMVMQQLLVIPAW